MIGLPAIDRNLSLNSLPKTTTKHFELSDLFESSGHFSKSLEFLPGLISLTSYRFTENNNY